MRTMSSGLAHTSEYISWSTVDYSDNSSEHDLKTMYQKQRVLVSETYYFASIVCCDDLTLHKDVVII